MKSKKGAELSINVIIIAVIALVVLAVLIFIFSGRSQVFVKSVSQTCSQQGGECKAAAGPCPEGKFLIYARGCKVTDAAKGIAAPDPEEKEMGPCCILFESAKTT